MKKVVLGVLMALVLLPMAHAQRPIDAQVVDYIRVHAQTPLQEGLMREYAQGFADAIELGMRRGNVKQKRVQAKQIAARLGESMDCLYALWERDREMDLSVLHEIEAISMGSKPLLTAYLRYDALLDGTVHELGVCPRDLGGE